MARRGSLWPQNRSKSTVVRVAVFLQALQRQLQAPPRGSKCLQRQRDQLSLKQARRAAPRRCLLPSVQVFSACRSETGLFCHARSAHGHSPTSVKNAEQVLFHSTLEPNTEVFSKVSCGVLRSTKFRLNFAKQRRNDMQPS